MTTEVETQEIENQTAPEAPATEGNTEATEQETTVEGEETAESTEEVATEYPTPEEAN